MVSKRSDSVSIFRLIDANFNRAKEGLRVCEDVCRYIWDEKALTREYKKLRHSLSVSVGQFNPKKLLCSRNIISDVGRSSIASEMNRFDMKAIFWANNQRVKESLRVLEEASKLINPKTSQSFKQLRYTLYAIETKALKRR